MPIWRKGEDDRPMSLVILRACREAIGVEVEAGKAELEVVPMKRSYCSQSEYR